MSKALPLRGIKVLDLSRVLAGPYCTMILADLGADVLKVERPGSGDETRGWGPPFASDGNSAYFMAANRNKRSLVLNFHDAADRTRLDELIRSADILVHNFTPDVAGRHGVDDSSLANLNSNLIVAGITGFGAGNSASDQPGYDFLVQAMSGLMSITGDPSGSPMKLGVAITDVLAGLYATIGILGKLTGRLRGFPNQGSVDISLMQAAVSALINVGQAHLVSGKSPERHGNAHPQIVPYQLFATKDSQVAIAVGNDAQFRRFCEVVDLNEISDDPQFSTNSQRVKNRHLLVPMIEEKMRGRDSGDWIELLRQKDIPCGPLQTLEEMFQSKWSKERQLIVQDDKENPHIQSPLATSFGLSETVKSAPQFLVIDGAEAWK